MTVAQARAALRATGVHFTLARVDGGWRVRWPGCAQRGDHGIYCDRLADAVADAVQDAARGVPCCLPSATCGGRWGNHGLCGSACEKVRA